jgi:hypothetical protein
MKIKQIECSEMLAFNYRHRGITQKKAYNIQNVAKVLNPESQCRLNVLNMAPTGLGPFWTKEFSEPWVVSILCWCFWSHI